MDAVEMESRVRFEAETVAFHVGDGSEWGRPVMMAEARRAFERYVPAGAGWKNPIDVDVPVADAVVFIRSVEFYHGRFPAVVSDPARAAGTVRVIGGGYVG